MTEKRAATEPNDLGRYFIERANAGDVDGLVALYEPNAVLAFPPGNLATVATQTNGDVSVEIARRQPDGTWLWATDQPALVA